MTVYSEFSHSKWWFSTAMLYYQRVYTNKYLIKYLEHVYTYKEGVNCWLIIHVALSRSSQLQLFHSKFSEFTKQLWKITITSMGKLTISMGNWNNSYVNVSHYQWGYVEHAFIYVDISYTYNYDSWCVIIMICSLSMVIQFRSKDHPSFFMFFLKKIQWIRTWIHPPPRRCDLGFTHLPCDDVQRGLLQLVLRPGAEGQPLRIEE